MRRTSRKNLNVLVTDPGPVTGDQYLKLQQKLRLELADYQSLVGVSIKEHYLITVNPAEPLSDPGLCLHLRLLDEYPELVDPEPEVIELVQVVKRIKRDHPELPLPMPASANLVGLMLGRNSRTSSTWSTGRATPSRKIMMLVRHLLRLLDERDDPDRVLQHYCELIFQEGTARGITDIFKDRQWPSRRKDDRPSEDDPPSEDD
jgi:hypothetical protein